MMEEAAISQEMQATCINEKKKENCFFLQKELSHVDMLILAQ